MEVCTCENNPSDRLHVTWNRHQENDTMPREVEEKLQDPAVNVITGKLQGFHQQVPSLVNHRRKAPLGIAPIL